MSFIKYLNFNNEQVIVNYPQNTTRIHLNDKNIKCILDIHDLLNLQFLDLGFNQIEFINGLNTLPHLQDLYLMIRSH